MRSTFTPRGEPTEGTILPTLPHASASPPLPTPDPSSPLPDPPENPLLQRYRGHRTRTWGDAEALQCIALVAQGHSKEYAAQAAGIPISAIIRGHGQASAVLCDAIDAIYAHEGAAHFEELVRQGAVGEHDYKTAQYVRMALELHGRLGNQRDRGDGHSQALDIRVRIVPGARDAPPAVEVRASTTGA